MVLLTRGAHGVRTLKGIVGEDMNKIISSAIKMADGRVFNGVRHSLCFRNAKAAGIEPPYKCEEGFLDYYYNFVDRKEAAKIAVAAGQCNSDVKVLFSEHIF